MPIAKHTLQFFTAAILEWMRLLADNKCKDIWKFSTSTDQQINVLIKEILVFVH